ncbi:MAG: DUF4410 domain-containing protein [Verrucomicrobiaceae bacterium]|nr:DUF4410 domain-containing protein [Verrucomicrobiaceae bacterium]
MKTLLRLLSAAAVSLLLCSCGTVGWMKHAKGAPSGASYHRVVVRDYTAAVPTSQEAKASRAKRNFPDRIMWALWREAPGLPVAREGAVDAGTLVVTGRITRCDDGNEHLRFLIGMGAGSSYFDAVTQISDGSGRLLGTIRHDKNSWPLGGSIAATQTAEGFMVGSAEKVAREVAKLVRR